MALLLLLLLVVAGLFELPVLALPTYGRGAGAGALPTPEGLVVEVREPAQVGNGRVVVGDGLAPAGAGVLPTLGREVLGAGWARTGVGGGVKPRPLSGLGAGRDVVGAGDGAGRDVVGAGCGAARTGAGADRTGAGAGVGRDTGAGAGAGRDTGAGAGRDTGAGAGRDTGAGAGRDTGAGAGAGRDTGAGAGAGLLLWLDWPGRCADNGSAASRQNRVANGSFLGVIGGAGAGRERRDTKIGSAGILEPATRIPEARAPRCGCAEMCPVCRGRCKRMLPNSLRLMWRLGFGVPTARRTQLRAVRRRRRPTL